MKSAKKTTTHKTKKNASKKEQLFAYSPLKMFFFFIFMGIVVFVTLKEKIFAMQKPVPHKVLALKNSKKPIHLFTSLLSPTASPSPALLQLTPTPKNVTPLPQTAQQGGFCLHVPMLMYHHVQPLGEASKLGHAQLTVDSGVFDQHMAYLGASGYQTISTDQVVAALLGHQQLPAKSIVVTLDDGYDDAYNYAFGIAKKYNVKLDLAIPSGLINNPGYLNWSQLKEMSGNSLIHIYNHTWSHASLGGASKDKIEYELTTSQGQLESNLGQKTNVFFYPYGSFSPLAISTLKEHGFVAGISTLPGMLQCDSFIMTLHRTRIGNAPLSSYGL